ncbi:MAG: hypothetical protein IJP98_04940 [Clostridia bacterium]|nr:hypothetical protein [Clostridia bacterium]
MEQNNMQLELQARSKKALLFGILADAIPTVLILIGYFGFLFGLFGNLIANDWELETPAPVFSAMLIFFVGMLIAGVVMLVLGWMAWRRAREVGLEARAAGVRRPPVSVVAHVLGLASFICGIVLTVIMAALACIFAFAAILSATL